MLIKLPPGMTPEQYWNTPEGQRTAEHQRRFQEDSDRQIAENSKRPTQYADGAQRMPRPTAQPMRSPITRPRQPLSASTPPNGLPEESRIGQQVTLPDGRVVTVGQMPPGPPTHTWLSPGVPHPGRPPAAAANPPVVPLPNYTGAGARQPATRPGQAQPKADQYEAATKTPMDTFQEIFEALEEMAPDLPSHQRRQIAQQLADEYRRERSEAIDSLGSPPPMAEPTEQMEFDQAYSEMQDVGRAEDRMKARMEAQLREDAIAERGRVSPEVQRARNQQRAASMLPQGPWKLTPGDVGKKRELRVGKEREMYREFLRGGMSPQEAARAVADFFAYMPN